jgi:hypothetical protein
MAYILTARTDFFRILLEVQQRGRDAFYAEYQIVNCAVMHKYEYKHR